MPDKEASLLKTDSFVLRQKSFLERLDAYLFQPERVPPTRSLVTGHCLMAVEDTLNECDVYFASSMWEPTTPIVWGDSLYPPDLEKIGLGRIKGVSSAPPLRKVEEALMWSKDVLQAVHPSWLLWMPDLNVREHRRT